MAVHLFQWDGISDTFQILLDVMERHFAALSLPDPSSDPKITRAISFSELPTSRRILIEQCYQSDDRGTLVKQYSCEQIFDKLSNSREVKVSEVVRTGSERSLCNTWTTNLPIFAVPKNVGWHNGNFGKTARAIEPRDKRKMESMEVEETDVKPSVPPAGVKRFTKKLPIMELNGMTLSDVDSADRKLVKASTFTASKLGARDSSKSIVRSRSASPKKINDRSIIAESKFTEPPKPQETTDPAHYDYNESKKKLRSLVPEESRSSKKSRFSCTCYKFVFFLLLSISTAIIAVFLYDEGITRPKGPHNFDVANMSAELRDRVYGQETAIGELTSELEKNPAGINIIALIGGTGVGKSYAVGMIAKYFSSPDYVFEYCSPLRKTIHEAFLSLSRRACNLVILENLRKADLPDIEEFVRLMENYTKQLCVYTIAVFNPYETGQDLIRTFDLKRSIDEVSSFFRERHIDYGKIIAFDDLDASSLDACIKKAADEKKIELSREELAEIRENLMISASGCKGAYAKVQLLVES